MPVKTDSQQDKQAKQLLAEVPGGGTVSDTVGREAAGHLGTSVEAGAKALGHRLAWTVVAAGKCGR